MAESNNNNTQNQLLTHIPPQALEMEKSVLGSLMVDESGYDLVTDVLTPDSFYDKRHKLIYEAIRDLASADKPYDVLAVKDRLEKNGKIKHIGGMMYLSEFLREANGSAGKRYYAEVIAEKYIKRQLITCTGEVQTDAFDDTVDSEELLQKAQEKLYKISESGQRKDYTQINPVIEQVYKAIQDASKNKGGISGIPTLFHKLDKMTSGWQNSDLIIIAARPAMGKTAFALSMARNIAVTQRIP
ncbi:MAG: DnaB-like helicase N-terminal domain-containing protein, partial [Bacteroidaceae bacterium]